MIFYKYEVNTETLNDSILFIFTVFTESHIHSIDKVWITCPNTKQEIPIFSKPELDKGLPTYSD